MTTISIPTNTHLMGSMMVRTMVNAGGMISDSCAASICSYWHGPNGHGATFSRLSHGIKGGVTLDTLLSAIENARANVPWDDGRTASLDDLSALEAWALTKSLASA